MALKDSGMENLDGEDTLMNWQEKKRELEEKKIPNKNTLRLSLTISDFLRRFVFLAE